jgi:hypothetical protein
MNYFSDRNLGPPPRVSTELDEAQRRGIAGLLRTRANDGWFGLDFPEQCPDGRGTTGTDLHALREALALHRLFDFTDGRELPTTEGVLDLIEFAYERIAEPRVRGFHDFFGHNHLVFERNGIAFELRENGHVERIAPEALREPLTQAVFRTGDDALDGLLERARTRFLSRDPAVRRESLEALWDAWERLKTLEGGDKRSSTAILLDRASAERTFRELLENEARQLTDTGNTFMIRHTEVDKIQINDPEHVDFLFHRLFALIRLLLRKTNRGG